MQLFLGVDGGQSSTIALIAREDGTVVGSGRSGPCNHVSANEAAAKFTRVMSDCVTQACAPASIDPATVSFAGVCCGMSGGAEDKDGLIRSILRTDHLRVVTDGEIALTGAFAGMPGIIVIAGTGSLSLGRNASRKLARAGGWGYIFGDEGSAFDIARQATRAALRFEEGWGPKTDLHPMLLEASGEPTANAMLHRFYSEAWPRSRVAQFAMLVDAATMQGDAIARAIMDQAAQSLCMLAACVREQIFPVGEDVKVSYAGGAFRSGFLLERFRRFVELSGCTCVDPVLDPASGALLDAFRLCGIDLANLKVPHVKTFD
jgi:N-acetylglucosamine kinase-like BadF-type ATPase